MWKVNKIPRKGIFIHAAYTRKRRSKRGSRNLFDFFFQFCHIFGSFFPQEYHILFTNFHCKYDNNIIYFQHLIIKLVFLLFHSRQYCQQIWISVFKASIQTTKSVRLVQHILDTRKNFRCVKIDEWKDFVSTVQSSRLKIYLLCNFLSSCLHEF